MRRMKKTAAAALSMLMAFSMAAEPVLATEDLVFTAAEDEPATSVTATVTLRGQAAGDYMTGFAEKTTVDSNLAESYGYTDSIDPATAVSALDAMVALHEQIFGEAFTKDSKADYLVTDASGYVSCLFGTSTYANSFLVNEGYPNDGTESDWGGYNGTTVSTTALADGDTVDFLIYEDDSNYSDLFSFIDAPATVCKGCDMTVTVKGASLMGGYLYKTPEEFKAAATAQEDAGLAWVNTTSGEATVIDGAVTDENGNVTITAPAEAGSYYLTAVSTEDSESPLAKNPVEIKVVDPVTASIQLRGQALGAYMTGIDKATVVASNLAESYGYTDSIDPATAVSALDAMVALHEQIFGEAFKEYSRDYLSTDDSGYVSGLFGMSTYANGFLVNGGYPNDGTESSWGGYNGTTVSTTALADGDTVDFFAYEDGVGYSDAYSFTTVNGKVYAGNTFSVNVKATSVMNGYLYKNAADFADAATAAGGAGLAWVDMASGAATVIDGAVTDEDGNVTITAPTKAGSYYLTAVSSSSEDGCKLLKNPVKVTVLAKTSIAKAVIKASTKLVYNGKDQKPAATVTLNGKKLKAGTDYTISYTNNKNVGVATIKVTAKGIYTGTKTASFVINPKQAAVKSITVGKKKMTVKTAAIAATGGNRLQLSYRLKGKSAWKTLTLTSASKVIKSLKAKKYYQVRVRAFKKVGSKTYYGSWSKIVTSKKIKK